MVRKSKKNTQAVLPQAPFKHELEVATLSRAIETQFDLNPDRAILDQIAVYLKLDGLSSLRFKGHIQPRKKDDWRITGRLTASAVQACVISLKPVPEKIDVAVTRDLLSADHAPQSSEAEVELDDGDEPDFFEDRVDLAAIALEELALAMEPYPRAAGAELETQTFAERGVVPLSDADLKPFAKLADLKDRLTAKE